MGRDLTKVFYLELMLIMSKAVFFFFNYEVWNVLDSIRWFYMYFIVYFVFRYVGLIISIYFLTKGKLNFLLKLSLSLLLVVVASVIFYVPHVEGEWQMIFAIAPFIGMFVSLKGMGMTNLISKRGEGEGLRKYQAVRLVSEQSVRVIFPVIFGFMIFYFGFPSIGLVVLITVLFSFILISKTKTSDIEIKGTFKNFVNSMIDTDLNKGIKRSIAINHLMFLLIGAFFFQFVDTTQQIIMFTVSVDDRYLGILMSVVAIIMFLTYLIFKRTAQHVNIWFNVGMILTVSGLLLTLYSVENSTIYVALFTFSIGLFLVRVVLDSMTFELIGQLSDWQRMVILMKRENYMLVSKVAFTVFVFTIGLDSLQSIQYEFMVVLISVLGIVFVVIQSILRKHIQQMEREQTKSVS